MITARMLWQERHSEPVDEPKWRAEEVGGGGETKGTAGGITAEEKWTVFFFSLDEERGKGA